ncbi:helix-turn-helix domain-containing protein [Mesorhizobium sp. B2-4-4]|uniref:helix-turn-helix domain-containing protein n=1 Tax=Mesorhizobium sp. B2-4-4 TaxID=2589945 RepID=UPI00112C270E|nr:helix-turn-helix domain-containing protein [Mesorhizobium sp. B2-4-4]TPL54942.1 helix-turn-helix domain-containing protein [Mesorhizobium sp. B2-4-4]
MTKLVSESNKKPPEQFGGVEPLLKIKEAAERLNVHPWALRRAVKSGAIPAYQPFNGRKLVRLTEIVAAINASKVGGENVERSL